LPEPPEKAHVFLPAAAFAEKDGTFTNSERRVQRIRRALPPPGQTQPDWWVTGELARGSARRGGPPPPCRAPPPPRPRPARRGRTGGSPGSSRGGSRGGWGSPRRASTTTTPARSGEGWGGRGGPGG